MRVRGICDIDRCYYLARSAVRMHPPTAVTPKGRICISQKMQIGEMGKCALSYELSKIVSEGLQVSPVINLSRLFCIYSGERLAHFSPVFYGRSI